MESPEMDLSDYFASPEMDISFLFMLVSQI